METIEYDVVVVGSGIAGAVVAKTLTDAGKKVLVLDAGLAEGMALDSEAAFARQKRYLETFYLATAKTPNSPYPNLKNAPSSNVGDVKPVKKTKAERRKQFQEGYFVQMGPLPFASDNWIGAGGTTQHWLGTTLRMLPNDFRTADLYGHSANWPISYADLNRYYEMAEFEIGVSGDVSDQHLPNMGENYFRSGYVLPMEKIPQSYLDKEMLRRTQGLKVKMGGATYTVHCCSTPQGRNSVPNLNYNIGGIKWDPGKQALDFVYADPGSYEPVGSLWDRYTGQRCEGNSSCVPICPVQAKYNALKTFKKAKEKNRDLLEIKSQAVAYQILIDRKTNLVQGIKFKRYEKDQNATYTTQVASGKIYVLAASAIENAKLLLVSDAANSSNEVGRNLRTTCAC